MDLSYSSDERELAALVRQVFATFDHEILRDVEPSDVLNHSRKLMADVANAGLLGIGFAESTGGIGGTLIDLGIVFREAGRAVAPTAIRSTIGAALHIDALGAPSQHEDWLPGLHSGEKTASLAFAEPGVDRRSDLITTTATTDGDAWTLTGTKSLVENVSSAGMFVVAAAVASGDCRTVQYFVVPSDSAGLSVELTAVIGEEDHGTITLADVRVPAGNLLGLDPTRASDEHAARGMRSFDALRAMEMVGIAESMVERTASYVTTRQQFGRPIGTFQAVQHRVADMFTSTRAAGYLADRAVWKTATGENADRDVAAAVILAGKTAQSATLSAHQVHAGMGYAKESNLYLWSRRAKSLVLQTSSRRDQPRRLAEFVFDR